MLNSSIGTEGVTVLNRMNLEAHQDRQPHDAFAITTKCWRDLVEWFGTLES